MITRSATAPRGRRSIHSEEVRRMSTDDDCQLSDGSNSNDQFSDEELTENKQLTKRNLIERSNFDSTRKLVLKIPPGTILESSQNLQLNESSSNQPLSSICKYGSIGGIGGILLFLLILYFCDPGESFVDDSVRTIEQLKSQFPSQNQDFFINIKVAVEEINNLNQPKSIILLHKHNKNIDNILQSISEYALFELLSYPSKPVVINGEDLDRPDILKDYGVVIVEIKEKLNESAVVIVKNIDKVPGVAAQAFHSLCDEYNPIEEKVLYLFTVKVDSFPKRSTNFIEEKLRKSWSDIHSDKFYPLYTRISSFILQIL